MLRLKPIHILAILLVYFGFTALSVSACILGSLTAIMSVVEAR